MRVRSSDINRVYFNSVQPLRETILDLETEASLPTKSERAQLGNVKDVYHNSARRLRETLRDLGTCPIYAARGFASDTNCFLQLVP
jgi:hypothetical protein